MDSLSHRPPTHPPHARADDRDRATPRHGPGRAGPGGCGRTSSRRAAAEGSCAVCRAAPRGAPAAATEAHLAAGVRRLARLAARCARRAGRGLGSSLPPRTRRAGGARLSPRGCAAAPCGQWGAGVGPARAAGPRAAPPPPGCTRTIASHHAPSCTHRGALPPLPGSAGRRGESPQPAGVLHAAVVRCTEPPRPCARACRSASRTMRRRWGPRSVPAPRCPTRSARCQRSHRRPRGSVAT
jgi:hypothetical protein